MTRRIALVLTVLAVVSSAARGQLRDALTVNSPQGRVELTLLPGEPRLWFTVRMNGVTVIEPSPIGFTVDGVDLADGVTPVRHENYAVNVEYPTHGGHALAVNFANGRRQTLKHAASGQEYIIDLRAYSDGVAFRLILPGAGGTSRVPDEATTFTLPAGTTVWSHDLRGRDEGAYEKPDAAALESGTWHAPPVTFKLPGAGGAYGAITEAALVNYSGMALEADGRRGLKVGLAHRQPVSHLNGQPHSKEEIAQLTRPAAVTGTITTPWRVVMLAADLNQLVNSDLIPNLNPPPDPKLFPMGSHTGWVLPGRAVWRHLDNEGWTPADPGGASGSDARGTTRPATGPITRPTPTSPAEAAVPGTAQRAAMTSSTTQTTTTTRGTTTTSTGPASKPQVTAEQLKQWSDLAGKLGFEYSILEPFWSRWSPEELKDLVESSRVQGVGIWVSVPARDLRTGEQRAALFNRCIEAGVVGLKIHFFHHEHKEAVDQYHAIVKDAAEHKLLLSVHGSSKPTGASRTWPNQLVRAGIRDMKSRLTERALHHTTLPFTRYPAGPGEHATVILDAGPGDATAAHQLATAVVFTAPLLTYAAHPQKLLDSPAVDVIRTIPPVWDETIVLPPSEIGEVAVFARRYQDRWFLAVLNGTQPRQLKVPLTFLGPGAFTATLVRDDKTPEAMRVEKDQPLNATETLTVDLPAGGGFVGAFMPKEQ